MIKILGFKQVKNIIKRIFLFLLWFSIIVFRPTSCEVRVGGYGWCRRWPSTWYQSVCQGQDQCAGGTVRGVASSRWWSGSVWRDVALPSRGRRRARLLLERPVRRVRTRRHSGCDSQPWRPRHLLCPPAAGQRLLGHASQRPSQPQVIPATHHSLIQVGQYYICILFELHYITTQYHKINYSLSPNIFKSIWRKNPIWIFRYRSTKIFKGNYFFHNNLFVHKLKNSYIFFMQTCLLFWF